MGFTSYNYCEQTPGRHNLRLSAIGLTKLINVHATDSSVILKQAIVGHTHVCIETELCFEMASLVMSQDFGYIVRRMRVYIRQTLCRRVTCVHGCYCFGGGSVMVLAGITHCGRTYLKFSLGILTEVRYRDEIVSAMVQPFIAGPEIGIFPT